MKLINGEALEELKKMESNTIDTVITDPPYGLSKHSEKIIRETMNKWLSGEEDYIPNGSGFMGKGWDSFVPPPALWKEVLRVMKPGGTALVFAGTRTQDLMTMSMRLAGFEIKDVVMWLYGSGFPKGQDIGKMIDKVQRGHPRGTSDPESPNHGKYKTGVSEENLRGQGFGAGPGKYMKEKGIGTPEKKDSVWDGYKTHSLKPAYEPIILAIKPNDGTYAQNALEWGVAGLNIDAGRIPTNELKQRVRGSGIHKVGNEKQSGWNKDDYNGDYIPSEKGRYPANILLDEESAKMLDEQSGVSKTRGHYPSFVDKTNPELKYGKYKSYSQKEVYLNDSGGASRFFYVAKASRKERGEGNNHPTVKPIKLIEYLVGLTSTPSNEQIYLDPFMGSGTTGIAVKKAGKHFIGIEMDSHYFEIAQRRIGEIKNVMKIEEWFE